MATSTRKVHNISFNLTNIISEDLKNKILKKCGFKSLTQYLLYRSNMFVKEKVDNNHGKLADQSTVILKYDIPNKVLFNVYESQENVEKKCSEFGLKMFILPFKAFSMADNSSVYYDNKQEWSQLNSLMEFTQRNNVQLFVYVKPGKNRKRRSEEILVVHNDENIDVEVDDSNYSNETEDPASAEEMETEENSNIKALKEKFNFELKFNATTCNSYILTIYSKKDGRQILDEQMELSKEEIKTIQHSLNKYEYRDIYWSYEYKGFILGTKMHDIAESIFM